MTPEQCLVGTLVQVFGNKSYLCKITEVDSFHKICTIRCILLYDFGRYVDHGAQIVKTIRAFEEVHIANLDALFKEHGVALVIRAILKL